MQMTLTFRTFEKDYMAICKTNWQIHVIDLENKTEVFTTELDWTNVKPSEIKRLLMARMRKVW